MKKALTRRGQYSTRLENNPNQIHEHKNKKKTEFDREIGSYKTVGKLEA